jgi:uncharacterized membrane protein
MRHYLATIIAPLIVVTLSIPLIAGWIGRNYLYGFRTPRTLSSDSVWYPANRISGALFLCAGLLWLVAGLVAGLVAIAVAILGSFVYASQLPKTDRRPD